MGDRIKPTRKNIEDLLNEMTQQMRRQKMPLSLLIMKMDNGYALTVEGGPLDDMIHQVYLQLDDLLERVKEILTV